MMPAIFSKADQHTKHNVYRWHEPDWRACIEQVSVERRYSNARWSRQQEASRTRTQGDGSGAMTEVPLEKIGDNMVLSNRDKA
jgi:hypothetical protein